MDLDLLGTCEELAKNAALLNTDDSDVNAHDISLDTSGALPSSQYECKATTSHKGRYLMRLGPGVPSAAEIQEIAGLDAPPDVYHAEEGDSDDDDESYDYGSDDGEAIAATFCIVDGRTKDAILNIGFCPFFIRLTDSAAKELSAHSRHPTLGVPDANLPQFRLDNNHAALPAQDEYPVMYFFYGTLCEPEVLISLLRLDEPPVFYAANVTGGRLTKTPGGRYNALVHGRSDETVQGSAYMVKSRTEEDTLRDYETEMYEVVRCLINFEKKGQMKTVPGLTFLYCGEE